MVSQSVRKSTSPSRFHSNDCFWYRDLNITERKNGFPVTNPDIFRLRDQNTQIQYFSTWILVEQFFMTQLVYIRN